MKHTLTYRSIYALIVLAMGVLLVTYSKDAPLWILQGVGGLFVLFGLIALVGVFATKRSVMEKVMYAVMGSGALVLGALLISNPAFFLTMALYGFAVLLILAGVVQLMTRRQMENEGVRIHGATYLFPLVCFILGLITLLKPAIAGAFPFVLLGCGFMLYALIELWSVLFLSKHRRIVRKEKRAAAKAADESAKAAEALPLAEAVEINEPVDNAPFNETL